MTDSYKIDGSNGIKIEIFGNIYPDTNFLIKIQRECKDNSVIQINPNGLAFILDKENKQIQALGCSECFDKDVSQNDLGYPTINNRQLMSIYECKNVPENISAFIGANTWLCPNCLIPISKLFPELI